MTVTNNCQFAEETRIQKTDFFFNPWGFQNCIQTPEAASNLASSGIPADSKR